MAISKQYVNYKAFLSEESTYKLIVMVGHEQYGDIDINPYGSTITIPDEQLPPDNSTRWEPELGEGSLLIDKILALNVLSRYEKEYDKNEKQYMLLEVTVDLEETDIDGNVRKTELLPTEANSNKAQVAEKYDIVIFKLNIKFA